MDRRRFLVNSVLASAWAALPDALKARSAENEVNSTPHFGPETIQYVRPVAPHFEISRCCCCRVKHTLALKGNNGISIDPKGKNVPLYQTCGRYRSNQAPFRKVTRFVSSESILW
jgi:hypothetical protein